MRGFGFQLDIASGRVRNWYSGADGVQRWADNDQPCNYTDHLEANFQKLFGDIPQPGPLAETEASEGVCGLEDES